MYTFAVVMVVAIVAMILITRKDNGGTEWGCLIFASVMGSAVVGVLVVGALLAVSPKTHIKETVSEVNLVQLDSSGTYLSISEGRLLESGRHELVYIYGYEDGSGFRIGQLSYKSDVIVIEDGSADPILRDIMEGDTCKGWLLADWTVCSDPPIRHEFHVPPGSVFLDTN